MFRTMRYIPVDHSTSAERLPTSCMYVRDFPALRCHRNGHLRVLFRKGPFRPEKPSSQREAVCE